jgi:hypothetical protein
MLSKVENKEHKLIHDDEQYLQLKMFILNIRFSWFPQCISSRECAIIPSFTLETNHKQIPTLYVIHPRIHKTGLADDVQVPKSFSLWLDALYVEHYIYVYVQTYDKDFKSINEEDAINNFN